jgi:hypothetical protein
MSDLVQIVVAVLAALTPIISVLAAWLKMKLNEMESQRNSYKEIGEEAVKSLVSHAESNTKLPLVLPLVPVVPEHNSPTSVIQQETAHIQTLRASLTAANLALGLPAREVTDKPT